MIISVSFCPQVSALPGSVFNMAPSHMFGNRLNPNSAMAALIAQSEASPAGLQLTHVTQSCVREGSEGEGGVGIMDCHHPLLVVLHKGHGSALVKFSSSSPRALVEHPPPTPFLPWELSDEHMECLLSCTKFDMLAVSPEEASQ